MNKKHKPSTIELDEIPKKGMEIEIKCFDHIWSSGIISNVIKGPKQSKTDIPKSMVTIRYTGWGTNWDETVPYHNNERLRKIFTYTTRAKCFVELLPKSKNIKKSQKKINRSNLWPCVVHFRMPNPDQSNLEQLRHAEEFLRGEENIFVQPYGIDLLPDFAQQSMTVGGKWLKATKVKKWIENFGGDDFKDWMLPEYFQEAYNMAVKDTSTKNLLLRSNIFEKGSLLRQEYRVMSSDGANTDNPFSIRDSSLSKPPPCDSESSTVAFSDYTDISITMPKEPYCLPSIPPPSLPEPVKISDSFYPSRHVYKLQSSNEWGAKVVVNGNDVFLGSFPTQTAAFEAVTDATQGLAHVTSGGTTILTDILAVPLETIVSNVKNDSQLNDNNFSLHEWTIQLIRHKASQAERRIQDMSFSSSDQMCIDSNENGIGVRKGRTKKVPKKRKQTPKKVNLERFLYV